MATTSGASPTAPTASVEVDVDIAPARVVAVALATGNAAGADVHQYLTGEATGRADQIIYSETVYYPSQVYLKTHGRRTNA